MTSSISLTTLNNQTNSTTSTSSTSSTSSSSSSSSTTSSSELQTNFLNLLVTELKNQDPTNPMDNSQLTTQLAQINTLQGIESLNTTLTGISGQISTSQDVQASSLVGQGVMVAGNSITVGTSSSTGSTATTPFGFSVDSAVDSSTATITDSTGKVVKTISLGAQTSGVHSFSWNGVEDDGSTAPNGSYNFTISAASAGQTTTATALNYAQVQGVNNNSTTTTLDLGSQGTTTLANVYQII